MRLLVLNPNTSEFVTQRVATEARRVAQAGTEIVAASGAFGARIIVGAHNHRSIRELLA